MGGHIFPQFTAGMMQCACHFSVYLSHSNGTFSRVSSFLRAREYSDPVIRSWEFGGTTDSAPDTNSSWTHAVLRTAIAETYEEMGLQSPYHAQRSVYIATLTSKSKFDVVTLNIIHQQKARRTGLLGIDI